MNNLKKSARCLPRYRGKKWIQANLPEQGQPWLLGKYKSVDKDCFSNATVNDEISCLLKQEDWSWPKRHLLFFSDLHADADAFLASLVASGGIKKTGPDDSDFKLTKIGRKAHFVIGGDCFDKGPSNLRLLRCIRLLKKTGAKVHVLAGNHDVRVKLGIRSVDLDKDPRSEHFFIRMGTKAIPFLKEIAEEYLQGKQALSDIPEEEECRRRLYPSKDWFTEFPKVARWMIPEKAMEKELRRLKEKMDSFEADCEQAGLSLRMVYAASLQWQELFLKPKGEFYWYFKNMKLALCKGSFLFIHAGLDDRISRVISRKGVKHLNRQFREHVHEELFEFYYGPLANTIRTKYREVDMPLTRHGVKMINKKGIYAIVHGHKNMHYGQRIMLRKGLVNFECDASVDRHTRSKEGLQNHGAAVTIFHPDRLVLGISTDYPYIKVFDPDSLIKSF